MLYSWSGRVTNFSLVLLTHSGHRVVLNEPCMNRYDAPSKASGATMRRREFITLVGSAVAMPSLLARSKASAYDASACL